MTKRTRLIAVEQFLHLLTGRDDGADSGYVLHLGKLHGLVRFALWRVPLLAIKGLLLLAFLGVLHSVLWFACILAGRFVLYRSLSALRGGTQFSLAPTLLALLRWFGRRVVVFAAGIFSYLRSSTWKRRWFALALTLSGGFFLSGVIVSLLGWGV